MDNKRLYMIYDSFLDNKPITDELLVGFGYNQAEINELVNSKILAKNDDDTYSIKNVDSLFQFSKVLFRNYPEKSQLCVEKCFELDPYNYRAAYNLFRNTIFDKNYDKSFYYLKYLSKNKNVYYRKDANYFLFLLSNIVVAPSELVLNARNLQEEDILINENDKRYAFIPELNDVRKLTYEGKFPIAFHRLNILMENHPECKITDNSVIRFLIKRALETQKTFKEELVQYAHNKEFQKIRKQLKYKSRHQKLSRYEEYAFKLSETLLSIQATGEIPKIVSEEGITLFDFIDNNNFEHALKNSISHNQRQSINNEKDIIYLLLTNINSLINASKIENVVIEPQSEFSAMGSYSLIASSLITNKIDIAQKEVIIFLELTNHPELKFLIDDLIQISILEHDSMFSKPMLTLTSIYKNEFKLDITNYLQQFYMCLVNNNMEIAKVYLDIIDHVNILTKCNLPVESLYNGLHLTREKQEVKSSKPVVKKEPIKEEKPVVEEPIKVEEPEEEKEIVIDPSIYKIVEKKKEQLEQSKGIIIVNVPNEKKANDILLASKKYKGMSVFTINLFNSNKVVFKYHPEHQKSIDTKAIYQEGNEAYYASDFKLAIEKQMILLEHYEYPKSYIYSRIGMCYLKLHDQENAIKYLTVASCLARKEERDFDYSELILKLQREITEDEYKPKIEFSEEDFNNNKINYYGIDNFQEIYEYIVNQNIDVESACMNLNLNEEQTSIVLLIFAQLYYSISAFEKGDLFLTAVERKKGKTDFVKQVYSETQNNKKFYKNKDMGFGHKLVLNLYPNSKRH